MQEGEEMNKYEYIVMKDVNFDSLVTRGFRVGTGE